MPGRAISDRFDAFLFDLDGVTYVGEEPLPVLGNPALRKADERSEA